jgi:beta-lactamase class A
MLRSDFLGGLVAAVSSRAEHDPQAAFVALERRARGRLGVSAAKLGGDRVTLAYREHERFPTASTFKLPLVMAIAARVDAGRERLDRRIAYAERDLLSYAPVTRRHVHAGSMTVAELCAAAIEYSDNTAANLLLRAVGGPDALTRFVRGLGDRVSRFDRYEPQLNLAASGDPRDSSTPAAMAAIASRLVERPVLSAASAQRVLAWLRACATGRTRIRAGVPRSWPVGDKTGTTETSANDVAILFPPSHPPIVIATYLTGTQAPDDVRDATLAGAARVVAERLGPASPR